MILNNIKNKNHYQIRVENTLKIKNLQMVKMLSASQFSRYKYFGFLIKDLKFKNVRYRMWA